MAFKMKGFPMIGGTKPMKMKKGAAMKMKKEAAMKEKMNMVKGPGGSMVPDFAVDGEGANDMKSSMTMKKESAMKMKKGEAMKMKTPMKEKEDGVKVMSKSDSSNAKRSSIKAKYKELISTGTDKSLAAAEKLKQANPGAF
jgi:hypothetical protein